MGFFRSVKARNSIKIHPRTMQNYGAQLVPDRSAMIYENGQKITQILRDNQWMGKRCFVLGGGESLRGFDYSLLDKELTIGTNKTFLYYEPTLLYSMDTRLYRWIKDGVLDPIEGVDCWQRWLEVKTPKIFLTPLQPTQAGFDPSVYMIRRVRKQGVDTFKLEDGICGGDNSGFGAVQVAIHLGANPIYLLGFDMRCRQHTHFHKGYPNQDIGKTRQKVAKFINTFANWSHKFRDRGFRIVNLNPESALNCFEFEDLKDVLARKR